MLQIQLVIYVASMTCIFLAHNATVDIISCCVVNCPVNENKSHILLVSFYKKSDNEVVSCFVVLCNNTSAKRNNMLQVQFSS
jgi:hypothetical protein